jgi:hypothetical protein
MKGIAMAALVAACGPTQAPAVNRTTTAPPAQPQQWPRTEDGRFIVYDTAARWCYSNEQAEDGGCGDDQEICEALRKNHVEWEYGRMLVSKQPSEIATPEQRAPLAKAAYEKWPACTERDAVGCFVSREILTGKDASLCYPFLGRCDDTLAAQKRSSDFRPLGDRCDVHRVR